jgi:spore coat protein CotH
MKKILILIIAFLTISFMGCDLFSTTTKEITTLPTYATTKEDSNQDTTTELLTQVQEVSYENLFDDSIYKKFVISFSLDNFLKLIDDMENYHDEFGSYRDNTIQEVDITYYDGTGIVYQVNEVGFRTKGNIFTRILPVIKDNEGNIVGYQQVSFQLEFNHPFDYPIGSTEYQALKSRQVFELDQLNFKNVRDGDYGIVTESISYDLYRDANVMTSNTSYAIIYFDIDGIVVPYGLYMLQEPIDDIFVERYFGENQDGTIGDLYKCTWQHFGPASLNNDYLPESVGVSDYMDGYRKSYALKTNKDTYNFGSLFDFMNLVNDTQVNDYYTNVSSSLDTDAFARALAMGFLIGSPDDFRSNANNYYMYFNNNHSYYIPFDMDNALGYGWNPYVNLGYGDYGIYLPIDQLTPSNWYGSNEDFVLVYNLLNSDEFKGLYLTYLDEYTSDLGEFSFAKYETEFNMIKELYQSEIDSQNHLGISYFDYNNRYISASVYFEQKIQNVRTQLENLGY